MMSDVTKFLQECNTLYLGSFKSLLFYFYSWSSFFSQYHALYFRLL